MIHIRLKYLAALVGSGALVFAAASFTTPQGTDWKISGPFGGTATTIAVDPETPKTLLAGALDTLLFRSDDYGKSWLPLNFPPRHLGEVTSALIDPADPNHYFAGVLDAFGGGLFESHDGGITWAGVPDIRDFGVRALGYAPSNTGEFVAGTLRGVMLSTDSGKSWKRISDPNNLEMQGITSIAVDPKDPNTIYAGTSHLPWKTTDGGKTWESIHDGMIDDSDVFSIYVNPKNPTEVYASACSGIYASSSAGESWRKIAGIPNTSRRTHVIRLDPADSTSIYAGTTTGLFKSPNGGTTWRTLNSTQVNSLAFDPTEPKNMYLAMLHDGIGKSEDGGQTIQPINEGFVDRYINAITLSGSQLVAIEEQEGDSTGLFASSDRGETWTQIRAAKGLAGVHLRTIAGGPDNDHTLLAANARDMFRSDDRGASWRKIPLKVVSEAPEPPVRGVGKAVAKAGARSRTVKSRVPAKPRLIVHTLTPSDVAGIWTASEDGKDAVYLSSNAGFFKSEDWGDTWRAVSLPGSATVSALYTGSERNAGIVVKTSGGLLISKDNAATWTLLDLPLPVADVNGVALAPDGGRMLVATRVGLYSSSNGGKNWTANGGGIPASTVTSVTFASGQLAYSSEYGQLYRSADGGQSWQLMETHLRQLQIRQLWCPTGQRLYAVCPGMGVLFRD